MITKNAKHNKPGQNLIKTNNKIGTNLSNLMQKEKLLLVAATEFEPITT